MSPERVVRRRTARPAGLRRGSALVALAVLLATSGSTRALDGQWYIGVGGGGALLRPDATDPDRTPREEVTGSGTLALGRDLDDRSSVQFQLYGLGEAGFEDGEGVGYTGGDASVLYRFFDTRDRAPVGTQLGLSVYGRFGLGFLLRDTDVDLEVDSAVNFGAGAGAEFYLTRSIAVRAEGLFHDRDAASGYLSLVTRFGGQGRRLPPFPLATSPPPAPVTPAPVTPAPVTPAPREPATSESVATGPAVSVTPVPPSPDAAAVPDADFTLRPDERPAFTVDDFSRGTPGAPDTDVTARRDERPTLADGALPDSTALPDSAPLPDSASLPDPSMLPETYSPTGGPRAPSDLEPLTAPAGAGSGRREAPLERPGSPADLSLPVPAAPPVPAPEPPPVPDAREPGSLGSTDDTPLANDDEACPRPNPGFPARDDGCALLDGVLLGLQFEPGGAEFAEGTDEQLDYLAGVLTEYPEARIELIAHTDDSGNEARQAARTRDRLKVIGTYLVLQKGIDIDRLALRSFGGTRPLYANDTADGRAGNNRIEIVENVN